MLLYVLFVHSSLSCCRSQLSFACACALLATSHRRCVLLIPLNVFLAGPPVFVQYFQLFPCLQAASHFPLLLREVLAVTDEPDAAHPQPGFCFQIAHPYRKRVYLLKVHMRLFYIPSLSRPASSFSQGAYGRAAHALDARHQARHASRHHTRWYRSS